jgi:hypothetical protein
MAEREAPPTPPQEGELRDFMLVVREALLMVVRWIERSYGVAQSPRAKKPGGTARRERNSYGTTRPPGGGLP